MNIVADFPTHASTAVEMAACSMTQRLRGQADDIVARLASLCPSSSLIRSAEEMRAVARILTLAAEHITTAADRVEAARG